MKIDYGIISFLIGITILGYSLFFNNIWNISNGALFIVGVGLIILGIILPKPKDPFIEEKIEREIKELS